jgi:hypothetical protein
MPNVVFGNRSALDRGQPIPGEQVTELSLPGCYTFDECLRSVVHSDGMWRKHSAEPPMWVESDDDDLAEKIAEHFGCPVGRPDNS